MFESVLFGCSVKNHGQKEEELIVGFWRSELQENTFIEVKRGSCKCDDYVFNEYPISRYDRESDPLAVIGAFTWNDKKNVFVGRYRLESKKSGGPIYWSEEGMLEIKVINSREILKKHLDSPDKDGWIFKKVE